MQIWSKEDIRIFSKNNEFANFLGLNFAVLSVLWNNRMPIFSGTMNSFWIIWNYILIFFVFGMTLLIEHKFYSKKWSSLLFHEKCQFLMLSGIFFFFFPNIPYVFTEIRHVLELCGNQDLYNRCFEAPWLIPILFLYSVIPIPLFVFTLKKFSTTLGKVFSSHLLAKIFPMFMLLMSALGVCFGLFERLNSWYIVTSPLLVANVGFSYLIVPEKLFLWGIFTMCFLAIYYFFEYFLYTKKGRYM